MKEITIKIEKEAYNELKTALDTYPNNLTVEKVLAQLIHDLNYDEKCNGSDEHEKASEWFERNHYNW